jgi:hypothetical protein
MPSPSQISICLPAVGDARDQFVGRLDSLLKHTPLKQVELRFGFALATPCRDYVLGKLVSKRHPVSCDQLPMGIERFHFKSTRKCEVWAWATKAQDPGRSPFLPEVWPGGKWMDEAAQRLLMMQHLLHDVRLTTEYAVCVSVPLTPNPSPQRGEGSDVVPLTPNPSPQRGEGSNAVQQSGDGCIEAGWLERLTPVMEEKVDYFGTPAWHAYTPREVERIQMQPWYMGVQLARRDGKAGVEFMSGPVVGIRSARLQDVKYPGEVMLGEMARQLGWKALGIRH